VHYHGKEVSFNFVINRFRRIRPRDLINRESRRSCPAMMSVFAVHRGAKVVSEGISLPSTRRPVGLCRAMRGCAGQWRVCQ
jgi:hypothetical protein